MNTTINISDPAAIEARKNLWREYRDDGLLASLETLSKGERGVNSDGQVIRMERRHASPGVFYVINESLGDAEQVYGACADVIPWPMNTTTASTDLDQPAEPLGGEPDDTAPLPECICPANGIGPDWVEVSECTSGLPHLSWCPRALAGVDSVGPFLQEPAFGSPEAVAQAAEQGEVWSLGDLYQKRSNFETERRRQIRMGFETIAVAHGQSVDEATRRGRLIASAPDLLRERNEARQQRDELADALEDSLAVLEGTLPLFSGIFNRDAMKERIAGHRAALRRAGRLP